MSLIDIAINAKRDIQTIEANKCKNCNCRVYISETIMRDRYKVICESCDRETEWFPKIDSAVIEWNKDN